MGSKLEEMSQSAELETGPEERVSKKVKVRLQDEENETEEWRKQVFFRAFLIISLSKGLSP